MLMASLVAGVPLPSENPASAQQDPVEAREDPDLTVHRVSFLKFQFFPIFRRYLQHHRFYFLFLSSTQVGCR
jgi:hypothetical protein